MFISLFIKIQIILVSPFNKIKKKHDKDVHRQTDRQSVTVVWTVSTTFHTDSLITNTVAPKSMPYKGILSIPNDGVFAISAHLFGFFFYILKTFEVSLRAK